MCVRTSRSRRVPVRQWALKATKAIKTEITKVLWFVALLAGIGIVSNNCVVMPGAAMAPKPQRSGSSGPRKLTVPRSFSLGRKPVAGEQFLACCSLSPDMIPLVEAAVAVSAPGPVVQLTKKMAPPRQALSLGITSFSFNPL